MGWLYTVRCNCSFLYPWWRGILFLSFRLYVHSSVTLMEMSKFLSSQKAFILGSWVPWRVCFHSINSGPRVYTGGEAGYQNLGHLKMCYSAFSFMLASSKDIRSDLSHPYDLAFCIMRWRSGWPIFHGWVLMPNISKTIWCMNVIPGMMDQCDTKSGSCDFALYLEDCLMDYGHTWDNWSVWLKYWPHEKYVGQWPILWSSDFAL